MKAFQQYTNRQDRKKMKKLATGVAIALGVVIVGSSLVTTVDKGHVGVAVKFGEVQHSAIPMSEGLNFKLPWTEIIEVPITDQSISLKGITISPSGNAMSNGSLVLQTADKMTTGLNVELLVQMKPEFASHFVQMAGSFNGAVNKYVIPALEESLNYRGSSIATAQDLFTEDAKTDLKKKTQGDMTSYLNDKAIMEHLSSGLTVKDVKYQRMVLPPRIQEMINQTKEREEAEEIALSNERKRKTDANATFYERQKDAEAKEKQADADAHRTKVLAEATEREADAKLYAMEKEADGIKKLNSVINPQYIKYIDAQANLTASQRYQGGTPASLTVMGENTQAVPFLNVGK